MGHPSEHAGVRNHPAIYAGRFVDQLAGVNLPDGCEVLSEGDVLSRLSAVTDEAAALVILDLLSFPFEAMSGDQWEVPLVVVLPPELDAESLVATFGETLFERIGFFDRLMIPDPAVWWDLSRRYGWAENQRVEAGGPDELVSNLCASLGARSTSQASSNLREDLRSRKAAYRVRAEALGRWFAAAGEERPGDAPLDVLEVGAAGQWAASFNPAKTRFSGVDGDKDKIEAARRNFPDRRFDLLGPDLCLPHDDESFDLVFSVDALQDEPPPVRKMLLSEMWRVTRPAGRLLFLEDFVFENRAEREIPPMSVQEFVNLLLEATANRVVLEHAESLRYPQDNLFRGGIISLLRLGPSRTPRPLTEQ